MWNLDTAEPAHRSADGQIELTPVQLLKPRTDNPRTHSKRQIEKIATSIKAFGFTNPILIDENNQVLAGHGRLAAARIAGIERVACRRLVDLSEAKKRAYVLADNKLSLDAGWDHELLAENFGQLEDLNFDLTLTGFDQNEVEQALAQQQAESTHRTRAGEDDVPEANPVRVTRVSTCLAALEHPNRRSMHWTHCQVDRARPNLLRHHRPALAKLYRQGGAPAEQRRDIRNRAFNAPSGGK